MCDRRSPSPGQGWRRSAWGSGTRLHVLRVNQRDLRGEARKVGDVQRKKVRDAVNAHRGHKLRVVDGLARYLVLDNEPIPLGAAGGRVRKAYGELVNASEPGQSLDDG